MAAYQGEPQLEWNYNAKGKPNVTVIYANLDCYLAKSRTDRGNEQGKSQASQHGLNQNDLATRLLEIVFGVHFAGIGILGAVDWHFIDHDGVLLFLVVGAKALGEDFDHLLQVLVRALFGGIDAVAPDDQHVLVFAESSTLTSLAPRDVLHIWHYLQAQIVLDRDVEKIRLVQQNGNNAVFDTDHDLNVCQQ